MGVGCVRHTHMWRAETSLHHNGPRNPTQVAKLGTKHLYQLTYLNNPKAPIYHCWFSLHVDVSVWTQHTNGFWFIFFHCLLSTFSHPEECKHTLVLSSTLNRKITNHFKSKQGFLSADVCHLFLVYFSRLSGATQMVSWAKEAKGLFASVALMLAHLLNAKTKVRTQLVSIKPCFIDLQGSAGKSIRCGAWQLEFYPGAHMEWKGRNTADQTVLSLLRALMCARVCAHTIKKINVILKL